MINEVKTTTNINDGNRIDIEKTCFEENSKLKWSNLKRLLS